MNAHAIRLPPGSDLAASLSKLVREKNWQAVAVVTCVGSLDVATVRFAEQKDAHVLEGPWEIVSLVGTLEPTGYHLHICLSDNTGRTVGGHLKEGSKVHTTAEVVLAELPGLKFTRTQDARTGYPELVVEEL